MVVASARDQTAGWSTNRVFRKVATRRFLAKPGCLRFPAAHAGRRHCGPSRTTVRAEERRRISWRCWPAYRQVTQTPKVSCRGWGLLIASGRLQEKPTSLCHPTGFFCPFSTSPKSVFGWEPVAVWQGVLQTLFALHCTSSNGCERPEKGGVRASEDTGACEPESTGLEAMMMQKTSLQSIQR